LSLEIALTCVTVFLGIDAHPEAESFQLAFAADSVELT